MYLPFIDRASLETRNGDERDAFGRLSDGTCICSPTAREFIVENVMPAYEGSYPVEAGTKPAEPKASQKVRALFSRGDMPA